MSYGELLNILRARVASIDEVDVSTAWKDPQYGPQLAEWAKIHLTADTLLSLDELELYAALQKSGREEELAVAASESDAAQGGAAPPLDDADLRSAIATLERSTEEINKQTDVLRQQQEAVARLRNPAAGQNSKQDDARAAFEAQHRAQRWDPARAGLVSDVEQLSQALGDRLGDLEQQNKDLASRAQQTVDGLCRSDDTLLASLQKLGWALPAVSAGSGYEEAEQQQQQSVRRLRDICLHLIKFTVETIRTKLDRLYVEALEGSAGTVNTVASDDGDVQALQEELESLYAEILPVAQMSVEQQYLEPALKALSGKNGKSIARSLMALDYINECLDFLLEHIALLSRRIEMASAHQAAADTVLATSRSELAAQIATARKKDEDQQPRSNYGSPVRRRLSSGASHARTRSGTGGGGGSGARLHRRRSSGLSIGLGDAPPLEQLLESLSLTLPLQEEPLDYHARPRIEGTESSGATAAAAAAAAASANTLNAAFLQSTLAERAAKADGVAANAQEAFEGAAIAQLADARRAVWMARASVLAETPFGGGSGSVQLADPEIDASIAVMAQEVGRVRQRLAAADRDIERARRAGSVKRDQMVARWG